MSCRRAAPGHNAGGPRCLKYGVTRDYVIGLTVVLASGEILKLGGKITKNATGYGLMQLFVGSEGTLGIVTQVTLKLVPLPRARVTATATFDRLGQASKAVSRIMASGVLPGDDAGPNSLFVGGEYSRV